MKCIALRGFILAFCFVFVQPLAEAREKVRPPLPKPKPMSNVTPAPETVEPEAAQPEPESAEPETRKTASLIVLPRPKPERGQTPNPLPAPKPEAEPAQPEAQGPDQDKPAPGDDFADCRSELGKLGARFTIAQIPASEGLHCAVPNPVKIIAIETPAGVVDFPGTPVLNCAFARRFTSWVADVAAPVVRAHTGENLAAIATGPGYECRNRNGDTTAKISEHASGNAVDIVAFRLEHKEILPVANVAKTGNVESRWLMALRVSACGYFSTVLGPGANAAHAEHYHFDLGLHGRSGNYRICE